MITVSPRDKTKIPLGIYQLLDFSENLKRINPARIEQEKMSTYCLLEDISAPEGLPIQSDRAILLSPFNINKFRIYLFDTSRENFLT